MPEETLSRLPELTAILRKEVMPGWEELEGVLDMEKVKAFADRLKQLGEEYGISVLSDYASRIIQYEENFDIDGIEKTLEGFPAMVDELVSHSEANDEPSQ